MTRTRRLLSRLRFWRDEDGASSAEFVVLMPVLITLLISAVESSYVMAQMVALERALDVNVRQLRLGEERTYEQLKTGICQEASVIQGCSDTLVLELTTVDRTTWAVPDHATRCYNRTEDIQPDVEFNPGSPGEMVIIRACLIIDPIFPTLGFGQAMHEANNGQFYVSTASSFVNEP